MDAHTQQALVRLIRGQRVAAFGTLHGGAPQVTMVAYAPSADLAAYDLLLSGLARHTRALREDPRVGLMVAAPDAGGGDPQRLERVSLEGDVRALTANDPDHAAAQARYLARFPDAARLFQLGDFGLYRIRPVAGRFVAGFGRAHDLDASALTAAARATDAPT